MKSLTTKAPLYLYQVPSGPSITLEVGSRLKITSIKESYHPYYELHSYGLNVESDNKHYVISCARYKGAKGSKSIRINSSRKDGQNNKALSWNQDFEEECEIKM